MRHFRIFALVLGLCALPLIARADNLVTNPDFGPANPGLGYGAVAGWTQSPYPSNLAGYPYLTGSNAPGGEFWDNGTANGAGTVGFIQVYPGAEADSLSQMLTLTVGQDYSFSFLENARDSTDCSDCVDPTLTVDLGGSTLVDAMTITPVGGSNPFDLVTASFVATSATEDLSFDVTGSGDATALITDVSVSATPEPSSLLLLGTGLAGVAGMARRRFLRA